MLYIKEIKYLDLIDYYIYRNLKILKEDTSFKDCLKYAIVGFFFSAITPAASGGQPVQIYYMHKDNINYTNATVTILIQSFSYLLSMFLFGVFGYIYNYEYHFHKNSYLQINVLFLCI